MRFLAFFALLAVTVYAVIDCARTPDDEIKHLPKPVWLIVIIIVVLVGPVLWLLTGRDRGATSRPAPRGPLAPDDDPDFLRRLAEQRRLKAWEAELAERERRLGRDGQLGRDGHPDRADDDAAGSDSTDR